MIEQRHTARGRVIYSGVIAYNQRRATMNCVIRNFSDEGAKVEFDGTALLPDEVELSIARKSRSFKAKIIWRSERAAGLQFYMDENNHPISLDMARRLRASEAERQELKGRLDTLLSGQ